MSKQLRLVDRLLLGVAYLDEFLDSTIGVGYRTYRRAYNKYSDTFPLDFWTPDHYPRPTLRQGIYRLLKAGYLEKKVIKGQPQLIISNQGRLRLERKFSYFKLERKRWDGDWRIVIFDLPESLKKWRDYLRNELKSNLGFWPLQESVYITPYPVMGELNELLKEWNLRKYFRYITVTEIDNEHELRQAFGLK